MEVMFSSRPTDVFSIAAVLWLKSEVSMIGLKFIAFAYTKYILVYYSNTGILHY